MTSSTAKGDKFEDQVFRYLKRLIKSGRFPIREENCRILPKQGYWSKDREKNIIFDIAIEIFFSPADPPTSIWIIECKNYEHPVPVDDSEEFYAKLQQISAGKGIIVSPCGFQEGTVAYCRSKRIGLLRYFPPSQTRWELRRSQSAWWTGTHEAARARVADLTNVGGRGRYDFCANHADTCTFSLVRFFEEITVDVGLEKFLVPPPPPAPFVTYVSLESMESLAESILDEIGYVGGEVSLDTICSRHPQCEGLILENSVEPTATDRHERVLARLTFSPLTISILDTQSTPERTRFTLAHELAHIFLDHRRYMSSETSLEEDFEFDSAESTDGDDIERMELQANFLASCILIPSKSLVGDLERLCREHDLPLRGNRLIYLDGQRCNRNTFLLVTDFLMRRYRITRSVAKLRLEKLGLLVDASEPPAGSKRRLLFQRKE